MISRSRAAKAIVTLFVIGVLLVVFKPWESLSTLLSASPLIVFLALAGVGITLLMNSISYFVLLQTIRPVSFSRVARYNAYSWVTESFLPGKVGSFAIAFFLQKEGVRLGEGLALALAYRISLAAGAFFFGLIGILALFPFLQWNPYTLFGIAFIGAIAAYAVRKHVRALLVRIIPAGILSKMGGFSTTLKAFLSPGRIILLLAMALIQLVVISGVHWAMYDAAGYPLPFLDVISVVSIVQLAGLIPISINGIGVREGLTAILFASMGVPESVSLIIASINTIMGYVVIFAASTWIAPKLPTEKILELVREKKKTTSSN